MKTFDELFKVLEDQFNAEKIILFDETEIRLRLYTTQFFMGVIDNCEIPLHIEIDYTPTNMFPFNVRIEGR